ncbi:MAG: hypothetical protein ACHQ5A_10975 [Opitutales bacterium]
MNPNVSGQQGGHNTGNQGRPGGMNPNVSGQQGGQNAGSQGRQFGGQNPGNGPRPGNTTPNAYSGRDSRPGGYRGPEVVRTRSGGEVHRAPGGAISEVRTPGGAVIHHAPGGERRVEMARPGGRVVVANSHGSYGYVQRPLVVRNTTYVQRTYVFGGRSYARVYRPYVWGGVTFNVYTPMHYYRPSFYAWAYSPWSSPVYYNWGWSSRPWYGYYGGWFAPYPVYSSPALWLTDYLIATTLEQAYQSRMAAAAGAAQANYASGGQVVLTPDVKQAVSDEVHRQLDQERAEQQAGGNANYSLFNDNRPHIFVVSTALEVNDGGGGCPLTEGDVLQMNGAPPPNARYADVIVLAGKGQDCRKGSRVQVALDDLQEMQNQMRATIDQGLGDLQSRQGQGGLPPMPASAAGTTDAAFASEVRPDANVASEISQVAQEGDRAEQDVISQADTGGAGTGNISLGMSIADVERVLGRPKNIADLGAKKIYVYNDMKITFMDGRVSDVQ